MIIYLYFYIFVIGICISGTGMILPALLASLGIPQHVVPVAEPSGNNDLCPVIDGTGITGRKAMMIFNLNIFF